MYQITFTRSASKDLEKLSKPLIKKISAAIDSLILDPRPQGSKKLKGSTENIWRIRIGDYRIIYVIEDQIQIIDIRRIRHRKDVYK